MKRLWLLCLVPLILIIIYIAVNYNDAAGMERYLQEDETLIHVEFLNSKEAVIIYSGLSDIEYMGYLWLKKNPFSWKLVRGSGLQIEEGKDLVGAFWNNNLAVAVGKIYNPDIRQVFIEEQSGHKVQAQIIENVDNSKIWYLVSDSFDSYEVTVTGLSESSDVLAQLELYQSKIEQ